MAGLFSVNALSAACAGSGKGGPVGEELAWPVYLGDQRHNVAAQESLNPDPHPLWHATVGRSVRGSPALGESVIAVGTGDRNVVLLDRTSGDVLWKVGVEGSVRTGPLLDKDRLFVATESQPNGQVYALRLRDGHVLWRARAGSVVAPLVFDTTTAALYVGTDEGSVLRLDSDKGEVHWHTVLSGAVRAGPLITPHGLLVATTSDTLYLLDPDHGAVRAQLALPGTVLATPATDGQRAYFGTVNGRIVAIDLASGTTVWDRPAGDAVYGAPALVRDTLFVMARNGQLWLIPVTQPDSARSHALGFVATAGPTPLASGGGVLVANITGDVVLVEPSDGSIRWRTQIPGPIDEPPLVRERELIVIGGHGNIHAFR